MESKELTHWGIKGMKWGIRRYQNRDGTLTAAGKKRYAEEMERLKKEEKILKNKQRTKAQLEKLDAKRKEIEEQKQALKDDKPINKAADKIAEKAKAAKKRKISELSDEELNAIVNRMRLEKTYRDLVKEQKAVAEAATKKSKGEKFVATLKDKVIIPAATDVGKDVAKRMMNNAVNKVANSVNDDQKKK